MRLYIAVREDLAPGRQASQAVHAAQTFQAAHPELTAEWMDASNRVVIVGVPDTAALNALWMRAKERGLRAEAFHDEDLDPPMGAVAIEPGERSRALCRGLPLAFR